MEFTKQCDAIETQHDLDTVVINEPLNDSHTNNGKMTKEISSVGKDLQSSYDATLMMASACIENDPSGFNAIQEEVVGTSGYCEEVEANGEDNHSQTNCNGGNNSLLFDTGSDKLNCTDMELPLRDSDFFNTSGLNLTVIDVSDNKVRGDGSDSGVESLSIFQRALSCNSTGYSSGGFDDFNKSCESSLLSYSEDTELMTTSLTMYAGDGTSEAGSESSIAPDLDCRPKPCAFHRNTPNTKKNTTAKSAKESHMSTVKTVQSAPPAGRRRQNITPIKSPIPNVISKTTPNSNKRDRIMGPNTPSDKSTNKQNTSSMKTTSRSNFLNTPDSHNKAECHTASVSKADTGPKSKVSVTSSKSASTCTPKPKTPKMDDGRWPSSAIRAPITPKLRRGVAMETRKPIDMSKPTNCESKATALDKYGTLPRRSRRKSPEICRELTRSISVNREQIVKKSHRNVRELGKSLPPYPRKRFQKTRIYHEISIQTALTSIDIEKALDGICITEPCLKIEKQDQEVQVDREQENSQGLEYEFKKLKEENETLKQKLDHHKSELQTVGDRLSEEKIAKEAIQEQMKKTELRLLSILGKCEGEAVETSLQELESHLLTSNNSVILQQKEIAHLQTLSRRLQYDLEKGLADHKIVLQQQKDAETESLEMQDFLQAEKTMLAESLRDTETEVAQLKQCIAQREVEMERKHEECKHLVRISEQRRQENMALQARLGRLEQRSKDLLLQQGATVSGAAVALSGLSTRLDGLVDQLVTSYDISEKDLEVVGAWVVSDTNTPDVIFHNEAYSKSNSSSADASPERTHFHQPMPSPKRRASFISAVVKAIRNATSQSPFAKTSADDEEKTPTVENVLQNSSSYAIVDDEEDDGGFKSNSQIKLANSESLHNLSQAILNRQRLEGENGDIDSITCDSDDEALPEFGDYTPGFTFVDQIIDVDNLVTKLLKVLRIIQLENDTTVDMLQEDRLKLEAEVRKEQDLKRNAQDDVRNWELLGARLRGEVQEAKMQLKRKVEQFEEIQADLQTHRDQVGMLNNEITSLSMAQEQLEDCKNEVKTVFEKWQETGELPSPDSVSWIVTARDEIPALKQQLAEKEHRLNEIEHKYSANNQMLSQNLHQAANEIRRQYEAIDNALEILHSIQTVVVQCPPLAKLQRELEETNFQCASTLPVVASDLNANAAMMISNGIHNNGLEMSQAVL